MTLPSLLLAAARAALILGVALAAMPLLARASAATRRLLLVSALFAVVLLPLATATLPPLRVAVPSTDSTDTRALVAASTPDPVAHAAAIPADSHASARTLTIAAPVSRASLPSLRATLLAIWAVGALAVLARLAVGLGRAGRLARGARRIAVERLGRRDVEVRVTAAIDSPAVTGIWKPVVLLPRDALGWTAERRHVVLLHELAHVARHDCLAGVIAQIACAMHWFNPLTWIAAQRLRIERELAADDVVLGAGTRASEYAEHLVMLATADDHAPIPSGALAMAERSQLEVRVRALLTDDLVRAPLGRGRRMALGVASIAMASLVACATTERPRTPAAPPHDANASATPLAKRSGASLDGVDDSSVDPALQAIADEETDRLSAEWATRAAVVVVLDPSTGAILAMANRAQGSTADVATQRTYLTGSTMKPFVVAAALEERMIAPTQRFDCENGSRSYGRRVFHDNAPHGTLALSEILAVSSNVGMSKVFDELGGAKLVSWAHRFHFGEAPSLPMAAVASGSVPASIPDKSYEGAMAASGELITATPLQVAAAFVALANGGIYHAPTLSRRGDAGERVLREETARTVLAMLEGVVRGENGTGKAARIDGVRVAGKTGTADLAPEQEESQEYYASFVGTAPMESPRYVVLVGAERPKNGGTGVQVAAPAFARIMKRALAR